MNSQSYEVLKYIFTKKNAAGDGKVWNNGI